MVKKKYFKSICKKKKKKEKKSLRTQCGASTESHQQTQHHSTTQPSTAKQQPITNPALSLKPVNHCNLRLKTHSSRANNLWLAATPEPPPLTILTKVGEIREYSVSGHQSITSTATTIPTHCNLIVETQQPPHWERIKRREGESSVRERDNERIKRIYNILPWTFSFICYCSKI